MIAAVTQSDGTGLIILICVAGLAACFVSSVRHAMGVRANAKRWWEL